MVCSTLGQRASNLGATLGAKRKSEAPHERALRQHRSERQHRLRPPAWFLASTENSPHFLRARLTRQRDATMFLGPWQGARIPRVRFSDVNHVKQIDPSEKFEQAAGEVSRAPTGVSLTP